MTREEDRALLNELAACAPDSPAFAAAFRRLYARHADGVRKMLHRYGDTADVSDLVQETFVKVWTSLGGFRRDSSLTTWIYRIAVNVARDHHRSRRRRSWLRLWSAGERPQDHAAGPSGARPDRQYEAKDAAARALAALPPKLREVLVLYTMDELDLETIAEVLRIPVGTVKSRLHAARGQMRGVAAPAATEAATHENAGDRKETRRHGQ